MPPQGESVGLALEDVVLLARILEHGKGRSVEELYQHYDQLRRPRINAAVKAANFGFDTIKDKGWFMGIVMEWLTWAFLAFTASQKEKEFTEDVRDVELKFY